MSKHTNIEWTDATWQVITGCSYASPGCADCYAARLAGGRLRRHPSRRALTQPSKAGPVWTGEVRFNEQWLTQPLQWTHSRRIFVCAHGDLFHESVPDEWIDRVFAVMALAPQHTFQVLTKRSERMREYCSRLDLRRLVAALPPIPTNQDVRWKLPLPNVWLGISAEDQKRADERIPDLLQTPAAVRFVSLEPLLGTIDLTWIEEPDESRDGVIDALLGCNWIDGQGRGVRYCPNRPGHTGRIMTREVVGIREHKLDWVIVRGESGPNARPMHPDWARSLRDQCVTAGVPFFFGWGAWAPCPDEEWHGLGPTGTPKQLAISPEGKTAGGFIGDSFAKQREAEGWRPITCVGKKRAGRELDGRTWDEMPKTWRRSQRQAGSDPVTDRSSHSTAIQVTR